MARGKLEKFAELKQFSTVAQIQDQECPVWQSHFGEKSLVLEVGCGKGEYTIALAQKFPEHAYIGVDIKGERIWRGAKNAQELGLTNIFFLRTYAQYLDQYFPEHSVSEIWVTFPDPFPRESQHKKRLTAPFFQELYQKLLKPGGVVHLKTDHKDLFEFTLEQIEGYSVEQVERDVHATRETVLTDIQTTFEKKFIAKGQPIYYVRWSFPTTTDML